jgi:hypothetical protein
MYDASRCIFENAVAIVENEPQCTTGPDLDCALLVGLVCKGTIAVVVDRLGHAFPVRVVTLPVGVIALPVGIVALPVRIGALPIRIGASPVRVVALPIDHRVIVELGLIGASLDSGSSPRRNLEAVRSSDDRSGRGHQGEEGLDMHVAVEKAQRKIFGVRD